MNRVRSGRSIALSLIIAVLASACTGAGDNADPAAGPPVALGSASPVPTTPATPGGTASAQPPWLGDWSGQWWNDNGLAVGEGTITLVQNGTQVTGSAHITGKTCVREGTITGTINGATVHLLIDSVRDVAMDGQMSGSTMSGTFSSPSCGPPYGPANVTVTVTGTWRASKVK